MLHAKFSDQSTFGRKRVLKVFGYDGHLGHATKAIFINHVPSSKDRQTQGVKLFSKT